MQGSIFVVASAYYWATYQGAELDLLLLQGGTRIGVEFKRADAPTLTASMRSAVADLRLDRLVVLYPGSRRYPLADGIAVMPLVDLAAGGASALGFRSPVRRPA